MPRFAPVRQIRRVRFHKHITQDRLSVNGARNAIKRWAAEAGVEGFISGHSLRVGSAVSLVQAGARWWKCRRQVDGQIRRFSQLRHYAFLFPVESLSASTAGRQEMRTPIWVPLIDHGVPARKLTQNFFNFHFSQKISRFFFGILKTQK